ncbi:MAG: DUF397 domain-containing protein [Candidatus Paceibacterota bacterium]
MSTATIKKTRRHKDKASVNPTTVKPETEKTSPDYQDLDFKTATMSRWPSNIGKRCVKVKRTEFDVQVKDSKLGEDSPILSFTHDEWRAFLDGAKKGEFDLLLEEAEMTLV